MNSITARHVGYIFLTSLAAFSWSAHPALSFYSLQMCAALLLLLLGLRKRIKKDSFSVVEILISITVVILLISSTGHLQSPLFFLNYVVLFELSLLLEPQLPLFLSLFFITGYYFTADPAIPFSSFAILLSFPFMTPLAYYIGNVYHQVIVGKREYRKTNSSSLTRPGTQFIDPRTKKSTYNP